MTPAHCIILRKLFHRGKERIALFFPYNKELQYIIRDIPGISWSRTNKCWHLPFNRKAYELLAKSIQGIAEINDDQLKTKKPAEDAGIVSAIKPSTAPDQIQYPGRALSEANASALREMEALLQLKAYSQSTIRTYKNELHCLLQMLGKKNINELGVEDVKRYLLYCINVLKLKENTIHSRLNALKFYFEQVLGRDKFFVSIPRPKKQLLLPKVLSEEELGRLFTALKNKKHKAMLFTAYSAGLRVSEIAALELSHIDSNRMQILVSNAKGKKDRYVNLSPVLLDILRDYIKTCRQRPKKYLFESEQTGAAYPTRTIQLIFSKAKEQAGIIKQVGIHVLRHSFATHMLEKGIDIFYIKDLLGHFDIKTTEVYLHVSKKSLVNIISPLDDLFKKQGIEW